MRALGFRPISRAASMLAGAWCVAGSVVGQALPVDPRITEAVGWYTGVAGRVDEGRARSLVEAAAGDGGAVSRMWLARAYSRGRMGLAADEARARELASSVLPEIRRLADADVTEAVFLMGSAYDEGLGFDVDPARAAAWFHRAADQGHVLARHNLGNAYAAGRGVPQSDAMAVYWWRKAAEQGDTLPQVRLAEMYEQGRGVAVDLDVAIRWYREAARRGDRRGEDALRRLGRQ